MPTYNRQDIVMRAVQSVLQQTWTDLELIVVDDGSTDRTLEVLREIPDERLTLVEQDHLGAATARNSGAKLARGKWITFLDSDDEASRTWLERYSETDEAGVGVITSGCNHVSASGGAVVRFARPRPELGGETALFLAGCYALPLATFREIGGFAPTLRAAQHTELAMRLVPHVRNRNLRIVVLDEPLVTVHLGATASHIRSDDRAVLAGAQYLLQHHRELLESSPPSLADSHTVAGVRAARLGMYREARQHLVAAAFADAGNPKRWARAAAAALPIVRSRAWTSTYRRRTATNR